MKLKEIREGEFWFECPGCKMLHAIHTIHPNTMKAMWSFNGDLDKPTFSPSLLVRYPQFEKPDRICHSFIKDGNIQFLSDCTNDLKDQIVPIPEFDHPNF